jgi:uncharacterized protein (DUF433 family)
VSWIAGSGLEVWDVVRSYRDMSGAWQRLRGAFDWLSEAQLRAALAYAEAYPEYVETCERREERSAPEQVWREYPSPRPSRGVLVVPRPLTDQYPERIARALVEYARAHPDGVPSYCLDFL